jgi:uncharacterized protein (TIGR00730 family)
MIEKLFGGTKKKTSKAAPAEEQLVCRLTTELLRPSDQSWRLFSIMSEFVNGFNLLRKLGPAITFWGSARLKPGDKYYDEAEELASRLAEKGLAIVTGGGGGIMEASNVGAFKVGGASIGLNIRLPEEQRLNPYTTESQTFDHFFARKVMLAYASEAYVYFPGGFGTLDELFEIVTLIQTKKITAVPVALYGKEFWEPLLSWMEKELIKKYQTISPEDLDIFNVVDSADEAEKFILSKLSSSCNFRPTKRKLRRSIPKIEDVST